MGTGHRHRTSTWEVGSRSTRRDLTALSTLAVLGGFHPNPVTKSLNYREPLQELHNPSHGEMWTGFSLSHKKGIPMAFRIDVQDQEFQIPVSPEVYERLERIRNKLQVSSIQDVLRILAEGDIGRRESSEPE